MKIQSSGRCGFTYGAQVKRSDGNLLSEMHVGVFMYIRVELHVTGSQHEGKSRLIPTL